MREKLRLAGRLPVRLESVRCQHLLFHLAILCMTRAYNAPSCYSEDLFSVSLSFY